ncbi:MAG TPA: sugar phosphate isomerase/epimerase [Planctomycetaceae bacterium]|nr:sugar phosphate isomerase/epimerase [Planctomycetaceae bacterium]
MQASNRRVFVTQGLQRTAALAATVWGASSGPAFGGSSSRPRPGPTVVAFTKSFQDWPIPEVCRKFRALGLDGLDLTVRPRGHIEPKDAPKRLPKAVAAANDAGVCIPMLTTAITDPDDDAKRLLETAAQLGIRYVKLGYYRYRTFGTLRRQLADVGRRLAAVIKLAKPFGVRPCVHIHAGAYLPSHGTLLYDMIRDFDPSEVGAYVDTLHMVLEGGRAGWRQGLDLLAPWITLCAVKNFRWKKQQRDKYGQQRWTTEVVPVADGISPIPEFVAALKTLGFQGIYSLHSEYKGRHSFQDLTTQQCLDQTAADLTFFRQLL